MRIIFGLIFLAAALLTPALAQTPNFQFSYRSAANPSSIPVTSTGTINFSSVSVGAKASVVLIISNKDTAAWTIAEVSPNGSGFGVASGPIGEIGPGEDRLFTLSFAPATRGAAEGLLNVKLTSASRTVSFIFFLAGTGLAPDLVSSYILAADGNQIALGSNDTISFPNTEVGQSSTGTFIISNKGNGPGTVTRIALTGVGFRLSGIPALPVQVDPDKELRFSVLFSPTTRETASGSLRVEFPGSTTTVSLRGQGIAPNLVYEWIMDSVVTPVAANGTIVFPSIALGSTTSAVIRIRNTGNEDGHIATIAVAGAGFQLADLPFLPAVVSPGQAMTFTVTFSPTRVGPAAGGIRIENTTINLSGAGLGSDLSFSVRQGVSTMPLPGNGTVTFPNTAVGGKSPAAIQILNSGNAAATINSISSSGDAFALANLPALPVVLDPGQQVEFTIIFLPNAVGSASGTVQVDSQRINLTGVGSSPPPLPAISFTKVGDTAESAQQPAVGLTLASPYPLDVTGKLTISFTPDAFADDPAIQFSSGGRTASFVVLANTTQAIFSQGATEIQFQTGTVAGTITITAAFATGAVTLTPGSYPVKIVTVGASAPRLRSVQIGARTASNFEVIVTGFSTLRSVTQMNLQFAPSPGSNLQTTSLNLNVEAPFNAWYQNVGSALFGSQFSAVVNIAVTGDINAVQSVTVTAANQKGTSTPVSANLR